MLALIATRSLTVAGRWLREAVSAGVLLLCALDSARAADLPPPLVPPIQGTFVQLLSAHGEWRAGEWERLFGYFRQLGLSQVIVQWSVYDDVAFYPSPSLKRAVPALESILRLADQAGMQVLVGLVHDSAYWHEIGRGPDRTGVYLHGLLRRSMAAADELAPLVRRHRSFRGWYVPQEVDDESWGKPAAGELIGGYLRALAMALHAVTPGAAVAVSGFSNAQQPPQAVEAFWAGVLGRAPGVDIVLFQDGVGARKIDLERLPLYLAAVRRATDGRGRELRVVVEVFQQVAGPPVDEQPFRAVPAPPERIRRQLEIAAAYTDSRVAFSVPEYLTPMGGAPAQALFESFVGRR